MQPTDPAPMTATGSASDRVRRLTPLLWPIGPTGVSLATNDAASGHYWTCPPAAQELMARRLAGQWT
jgi:hypothetical protein